MIVIRNYPMFSIKNDVILKIRTAYFNSVKSSELISFNKVLVVLKTGNVLSINSFICFFVFKICSFFKFNFLKNFWYIPHFALFYNDIMHG